MPVRVQLQVQIAVGVDEAALVGVHAAVRAAGGRQLPVAGAQQHVVEEDIAFKHQAFLVMAVGVARHRGTGLGAVQQRCLAVVAAQHAAAQAGGNSGSTLFTFTVTRSGTTRGESSVNWAVTSPTEGGATADDFSAGLFPSGTLVFASGERQKTISVAVATDTAYERCEDFVVSLSDPSPGAVLTTASALATILNDDAIVEAGTADPIIIPSQGEIGRAHV